MEYLAIPYSDGSEEVMAFRAEVSDFIFSELSKGGRIIYAPISSCHHIAIRHGLPRDYKFWEKMCEAFVGASKRLVLICLPGWKDSVGVTAELKLAKDLGLEIEYLDPQPYLDRLGYAGVRSDGLGLRRIEHVYTQNNCQGFA
jgi:hypothetical protein